MRVPTHEESPRGHPDGLGEQDPVYSTDALNCLIIDTE